MSGTRSSSPARLEIRALTGLRLVAALWVVAIHYQGPMIEALGAHVTVLRPVMQSGWLGVDLFFLLSGFMMWLSYAEEMGPRWSARRSAAFLWARVCRIWPLWALLTTLTFAFLVATHYQPVSAVDRHVSVGGLVEQLAMVQMWHRQLLLGASFIQPGWSLSVEFLAYVCFPLLVLVLWRIRRLPAPVLAVLAVAAMLPMALLSYQEGLADYTVPWPVRIAGAFVSGAITCMFVEKVKESDKAEKVATAVTVLTVLELAMICLWADTRLQAGEINQYGVAVVLFPVLIGSLALSTRGIARFLSWEPVVLGGRISFALYLVHTCFFDALGWLRTHVTTFQPGSPAFSLLETQMLPMSLGAAWLLWRFVEEPSRKRLRNRGPGRWTRVRPLATAPDPVAIGASADQADWSEQLPPAVRALRILTEVTTESSTGLVVGRSPGRSVELPTARIPVQRPSVAVGEGAPVSPARTARRQENDDLVARR